MNFTEKLEAFERQLIEEILAEHEWNIWHTAAALKMHRNTLRTRIKRLGVKFPDKYKRRNAKFADAQSRAMTHRVDASFAAQHIR